MKRTGTFLTGALVALFALAPAASAQDSTVTATSTSDLSLSVPATVVTAGTLKPGATTTFTPSEILVTAPTATSTNPWTLKVKDSTNAGVLKKGTDLVCTDSAGSVTNALTFSAATAIQSAGGLTGTVAATDVSVASGTSLSDTVTATYAVAVPSNTQLLFFFD